MNERPSGTVTFLFTDIEGSTRLWEHHHRAMKSAVDGMGPQCAAFTVAHVDEWVETLGS